jgi:hypothetical protein
MGNSIDLTTIFLRVMDEVYKKESVTARMDRPTQNSTEFDGTANIKVMKLSTVGLGNYSRANGYPAGDITATWELLTLACERGRQFVLDRMDNEESLGLILGNVIRMWMREKVAPEIDAYRFAKFAGWSGIQTVAGATLSASTVLAAIDAASLALDEEEVPSEGRLLFVSSTVNKFLQAAITRMLGNENTADRRLKMLDDMTIIPVPQSRFKTAIDLNAGASGSAGGFTASAGAKDINFELIHPSAVLQATKLNQVKYFSPEVNQLSDGHLWQYRLYHDAFVEENKVKGVYLHKKA